MQTYYCDDSLHESLKSRLVDFLRERLARIDADLIDHSALTIGAIAFQNRIVAGLTIIVDSSRTVEPGTLIASLAETFHEFTCLNYVWVYSRSSSGFYLHRQGQAAHEGVWQVYA